MWQQSFPLQVNAHRRRPFPLAMIDITIGVYFIVFVASKGWRGTFLVRIVHDVMAQELQRTAHFAHFSVCQHQSELMIRAVARIARPENLVPQTDRSAGG
jgi:NAD(P)H-flavin reductase